MSVNSQQPLLSTAQMNPPSSSVGHHAYKCQGLDVAFDPWLQVLSTRARKDVKVADIKVQVCLYAFDCLYLNGQVLVDRPLTARREALYSAISEKPGELFYATAKVLTC